MINFNMEKQVFARKYGLGGECSHATRKGLERHFTVLGIRNATEDLICFVRIWKICPLDRD